MRAMRVASTNFTFNAPPGEEDRIYDLPCEIREESGRADGERRVYATFVLEDWEREAIAAGQNIELGVTWIGGFPPVSLAVTPAQPVVDDPPA